MVTGTGTGTGTGTYTGKYTGTVVVAVPYQMVTNNGYKSWSQGIFTRHGHKSWS